MIGILEAGNGIDHLVDVVVEIHPAGDGAIGIAINADIDQVVQAAIAEQIEAGNRELRLENVHQWLQWIEEVLVQELGDLDEGAAGCHQILSEVDLDLTGPEYEGSEREIEPRITEFAIATKQHLAVDADGATQGGSDLGIDLEAHLGQRVELQLADVRQGHQARSRPLEVDAQQQGAAEEGILVGRQRGGAALGSRTDAEDVGAGAGRLQLQEAEATAQGLGALQRGAHHQLGAAAAAAAEQLRHIGGHAAAEVLIHPGGAIEQEAGAEIGGVGIEGKADRALGKKVEIEATTQFEDIAKAGVEVEVDRCRQTLKAQIKAVVVGGELAAAIGIGTDIGEVIAQGL